MFGNKPEILLQRLKQERPVFLFILLFLLKFLLRSK